MSSQHTTVTCPDCEFEDTFEKLGRARAAVETHRRETGHDPVWELADLDEGVVRAGDAAGVCGIPDTGDDFTESDADEE